ncbi:PfkB family carbohydrate kinase [Gordonia sp. 'Campus']|uniref:PfkB family carbohydrate kinase n=1 Tax=Gordonia sp. 'Campus' TaxID=2915824 RepID=UPI001EE4140E|nr:PfkB family carbohydrate kinase [Gordonia sp. 'Campus']
MSKLLVVGAVNVDLVVETDRLPGPGETVVGPTVTRHGGGKGANAAVAAARSGAHVRYCGAVGSDDMGKSALTELRDEGVDVTDVAVLDEVSTGMALIVVDPRGENQIAVGAGANGVLDADVVRTAVRRAAGWAGCVLVSTEIPADAVAAAVETAVAHGIRCVVNPAPVLSSMTGLVSSAPILTPNSSELRILHGMLADGPDGAESSAETQVIEVAARTGAPVIVTLGADGVLIADPRSDPVTPSDLVTLPAGRVDQVVDTTGAGDTFNGVFAAALAGGSTVVDAASRGVVAASLSVAAIGARTGMPRDEEIRRAL